MCILSWYTLLMFKLYIYIYIYIDETKQIENERWKIKRIKSRVLIFILQQHKSPVEHIR
jgi:hypothetical protein